MIIVTGGSGKAGRACISELLAHNYEVASVDLVRAPDLPVPFSRGFWCKRLKSPVHCRNARDDGTDLGTRSLQGAAF